MVLGGGITGYAREQCRRLFKDELCPVPEEEKPSASAKPRQSSAYFMVPLMAFKRSKTDLAG
jgi:hypothetical protein